MLVEWEFILSTSGVLLFILANWPPLIHYLRTAKIQPVKKSNILDNDFEDITIIIPTRNESSNILRKVSEIRGYDYDLGKINLIFADYQSSDGTPDLIYEINTENNTNSWKLISVDKPGKSHAINKALDITETDIVIITDADSECRPSCIKLLVSYLKNPEVGSVCGMMRANPKSTQVEYRRRFNKIRLAESSIDSTPIFEGSIYAFRLSILNGRRINEDINADDSQVAIMVRQNGFRSIMAPDVIVSDQDSSVSRRRRVRRAQGLIRVFWHFSKKPFVFENKFRLFMNQAFYFHLLMPWIVSCSLGMIFFAHIPNNTPTLGRDVSSLALSLGLVFAIFRWKTIKEYLLGISVLIEAQIRLIFGQRLNIWEPER